MNNKNIIPVLLLTQLLITASVKSLKPIHRGVSADFQHS